MKISNRSQEQAERLVLDWQNESALKLTDTHRAVLIGKLAFAIESSFQEGCQAERDCAVLEGVFNHKMNF